MQQHSDSYLSIFLKFLKFGCLAWGGPVAQINMIREELVDQKNWITPEKFKRVLAVYQALPGPEAHEICVYFGMIRKGHLGGFLAGLGFMLPGFLLILMIAYAYQFFGAATLLPIFSGVAPAVCALIIRALCKLGMHTLTNRNLQVIALFSAIFTLLNIHFLLIFFLCGVWQYTQAKFKPFNTAIIMLLSVAVMAAINFYTPAVKIDLPQSGALLIEGLKGGLLSFGGAYTAIPFLNDSMVGNYNGITQQSFLDSIALSNMIPAPLVIFGTFLGFLAGGFLGACLMTLGIFLPAFLFTLCGHRYIEKIIDYTPLHNILEGISAAVIGILAVTGFLIFMQTINGILPLLLFILAFTGLTFIRAKWATPAIIIFCGVLGYIATPLEML